MQNTDFKNPQGWHCLPNAIGSSSIFKYSIDVKLEKNANCFLSKISFISLTKDSYSFFPCSGFLPRHIQISLGGILKKKYTQPGKNKKKMGGGRIYGAAQT